MTSATVIAPAPGAADLRRPVLVRTLWLLIGLVVLVVLTILSISFGVRAVSFDDIAAALTGHTDTIAQAAIVKRIPRTVLALLVGAALALSGATMQAVTRNPIADPGILGVSNGASLAVVCGIAFFGLADPYGQMAFAIAGAGLAAVFVYTVGSLGRGGATPLKLALAGAATSAAFASLISAVMLPRVDLLQTFQSWQIGGVGGAEWPRIALTAPVLAIGALICFLCSRGMNSLALGDEMAKGLGENVFRTRMISALGAVILAGAATAIAGPIGFVGLIIPHVCRMLVGTDHRWLLPFSAIAGAALLTASDIVGRVIAPSSEEIQVGIITAIIGAPFFIWIVRRQKVREL
ncbi:MULTISPECIES: FecCD family ABC transporter permease [Microbacterium]|uniref:ABC transporter permease n=1 Tax=Microbacterium maritypicum MF109 TaxID=1333857 RepID=T5L0Z1_MICMQ|nr:MULTISPECIES: iron ABC transporter permease [Microbacterium]NIG63714.1 iron chelate uptake ABC transporter family permease subunit [Microbacterium sp. Be9]EQM85682.1 ABC transporter permease [Microbacterium maritypicum MF109]MCV0335859.1 iron ABC transporter permease [Microbacterium sp.]MCV0376761.1 iron ABC transporter permease [Microbacterium sp.]MCV0391510.1 iron ABC transporter permease [Microbacterium sp.]